MGLSRELQIGKAAEHLVCFDLIIKNHNAFLADQGLPYDVLIDLNGKIKRIQVKSTLRARDHGKSKNVYRFDLRTGKGKHRCMTAISVDYIAFVFIDIATVQYLSVKKISSKYNPGHLKGCIEFMKEGRNTQYIIGKFNDIK